MDWDRRVCEGARRRATSISYCLEHGITGWIGFVYHQHSFIIAYWREESRAPRRRNSTQLTFNVLIPLFSIFLFFSFLRFQLSRLC